MQTRIEKVWDPGQDCLDVGACISYDYVVGFQTDSWAPRPHCEGGVRPHIRVERVFGILHAVFERYSPHRTTMTQAKCCPFFKFGSWWAHPQQSGSLVTFLPIILFATVYHGVALGMVTTGSTFDGPLFISRQLSRDVPAWVPHATPQVAR